MSKKEYIKKILTDILNNKYSEKSAEEILQSIDGIELVTYLKNCIEWTLYENSEASAMVIPIFYFYTEVNNGGFHQFLSNSSGSFAEDLKTHLSDIGANKAKELLERISLFFSNTVIPCDDGIRNDILDQIEDNNPDFFDEIDIEYVRSGEDVTELLKIYLIPRIHEFGRFL